jgi:hypothetical protein
LGKLSRLLDDGAYLGVKGSPGEVIVGNKDSVWGTRAARRKPRNTGGRRRT